MSPTQRGAESPILVSLLLLAVLAVLVFLSQWPYLAIPLGDNEGFYSFYALQMGRGLQLYRDLWDHKPPGLFLQYGLLSRVMPLDEVHLRLYACLVHFINALLITRLGRKLGFSRLGYWGAAFIYVLFLFPALLQPWSAEADLLGLPFLLLSLVLAFSPGWVAPFLSGGFFAMAFLTKQSAGMVLPAFMAIPALRDGRKAGAWAIGAAVSLSVLLFPFILDGRFPGFWDAFAHFNRYYVSRSWSFFLSSQPFRDFELQWLRPFLLLYGLPVGGWVYFLFIKPEVPEPSSKWPKGMETPEVQQGTPERTAKFFLGLWFGGALASCFLSAYFFSYYFIVLLPPLSLALGFVLGEGLGKKIVPAGLLCGWVLGVALASGLNLGGVGEKLFSLCQYATDRLETDRNMGLMLRRAAQPGDKLFCWACEPSLYAYSGLPMAVTRTPVINHLQYLTSEEKETFARFSKQLPRFCVVSRSPQVIPPPDWLNAGLSQNYARVNFGPGADTQGLEFYVLNQGNGLEKE